jgi:hypothetical protein
MKALFTAGFSHSRSVWRGDHPVGALMGSPMLGQDTNKLDEAYRNKYLGKIGVYLNKQQAMNAVIALATNDPTAFRNYVQGDAAAFLSAMYEAQGYFPDVQRTYARLQSDSPDQWYATSSEMDNSENWTRDIDKMYAIFQSRFPGGQLPARAGMAPGAAMPAAPQAQILGIPQNTFLIGAGIVGLGILAAVLA